MLVGNKCDKEREIPLHIAEQFAVNNEFDLFMETSALQADNVEKLFYEIADILVQKRQAANGGTHGEASSISNQLADDSNQKSQSSCLGACQLN